MKIMKAYLQKYGIRRFVGSETGLGRELTFWLFRALGVVDAWNLLVQRRRPSIVCYHDPDPEKFARHLTELKKNFNIISLRDLADAFTKGRMQDLPNNSLVLSMDDGHARNFRLLETIVEQSVPVTIFLVSGVVCTNRHFWWTSISSDSELRRLKDMPHAKKVQDLRSSGVDQEAQHVSRQALSRREIATMRKFVDFQAHTRFHPVLPKCTTLQAKEEIVGSRRDLTQEFGFDIYAIAYPHGYYSLRDIHLVREAGFSCAVTVDEGLNSRNCDRFRLKRIFIPDDADADEAVVKASGLWAVLTKLRGKRPEHGYRESWEK